VDNAITSGVSQAKHNTDKVLGSIGKDAKKFVGGPILDDLKKIGKDVTTLVNKGEEELEKKVNDKLADELQTETEPQEETSVEAVVVEEIAAPVEEEVATPVEETTHIVQASLPEEPVVEVVAVPEIDFFSLEEA